MKEEESIRGVERGSGIGDFFLREGDDIRDAKEASGLGDVYRKQGGDEGAAVTARQARCRPAPGAPSAAAPTKSCSALSARPWACCRAKRKTVNG